jgi:acetyl esterase/lipase
MPPDAPYPAAMDDAMAVWKEAVKMAPPKNMAIFGTFTGGAMTLAMVLRAKAENLPLPGAIAPGTPWSTRSATPTRPTNGWTTSWSPAGRACRRSGSPAPETKEVFTDIANFFDRHLGN